jgi:hypothetical protein
LAALLRAVRLFAGGTVTYLSLSVSDSESDRVGSSDLSCSPSS